MLVILPGAGYNVCADTVRPHHREEIVQWRCWASTTPSTGWWPRACRDHRRRTAQRRGDNHWPGWWFRLPSVFIQHVSAGTYVGTLTLVTGLPEVIISVVKSATFGTIAGPGTAVTAG